MIKSWKITNFKSYKDALPISLSSINVLAGANSSGKSSIIQSILLLKQTLQYGSANRPLSLNGPLLRLGSFDDVRNFEAGDEALGLAVEFSFKPEEALGPSTWARHLNRHYQGSRTEALQSLSLDLAFRDKPHGQGATVTASSLTPILTKAEIRARRGTDSGATTENYVSLTRRNPNPTEDDEAPFQYWRNEVELDPETKALAFSGKPEANLAGGMYSYFLPAWVAVNFNAAAQNALQVSTKIFERTQSFSHGPDLDDETVSSAVVAVVNDFLLASGANTIEVEDYVLASIVRDSLAPSLRNSWSFDLTRILGSDASDATSIEKKTSIARLREQVTTLMLSEAIPEFTVDFEAPPIMALAKDFIQEFFKTGIRYLGPLRDSPRPVYQLEALESTTDVGYRGEHTAAILDLNSSRRIAYRRPPTQSVDQGGDAEFERTSATLHDAVVEWLTYLGVATDVATTDAGVFGNRLQVSTDAAGRLHDLTNVGVGVSQVLPIVVMALLAQRGSFLIFEQPELHLHPKVQARLADFFISLALDGKQMLLETHSEYLIDRFRLRIALAENNELRALINMLFSEKIGSSTALRSIDINEYGAIVDWPKDFFEQSDKDVGRILRAATKKRQDRQKKS